MRYQLQATKILMYINSVFMQILIYFEMLLHFLFMKHHSGLYKYIKFFNFGLKNIYYVRRDTWQRGIHVNRFSLRPVAFAPCGNVRVYKFEVYR